MWRADPKHQMHSVVRLAPQAVDVSGSTFFRKAGVGIFQARQVQPGCRQVRTAISSSFQARQVQPSPQQFGRLSRFLQVNDTILVPSSKHNPPTGTDGGHNITDSVSLVRRERYRCFPLDLEVGLRRLRVRQVDRYLSDSTENQWNSFLFMSQPSITSGVIQSLFRRCVFQDE